MTNLELNIPSGLQHGDYISCRIEDEIVNAEVFISRNDVAVRLTAQGIGLQANSHIMLMQPASYIQEGSKYLANERGISRVQELMIGLVQDYQVIQKNKNKILNRLPQYKEYQSIHEDTLEVLSQEKISAKSLFKQGLISQRDYMAILNGIRKREFICRNELRSAFHNIFDDILSECTHSENLEEIISGLC